MTRFKFFSDTWGFFSQPFELLLAGVQVLSGILYLIGHSKPGTLEAQLPPAELKTWVIGYTVGGALTVLSRLFLASAVTERSLEIGSRVEAVSLTISGGAIGMYAISIMALGVVALPSAAILSAWALAGLIRVYAIQKQWAPFRKARNRKVDDEL